MILTKSKIYETRIFVPEFLDIKSRKINNWNKGRKYAVEKGYNKLVGYFNYKGVKNWEIGLRDSKKEDLIYFFMKKSGYGLKNILLFAINTGSSKIVDYCIDEGACDWDIYLRQSSDIRRMNLMHYFVTQATHNFYWPTMWSHINCEKIKKYLKKLERDNKI